MAAAARRTRRHGCGSSHSAAWPGTAALGLARSGVGTSVCGRLGPDSQKRLPQHVAAAVFAAAMACAAVVWLARHQSVFGFRQRPVNLRCGVLAALWWRGPTTVLLGCMPASSWRRRWLRPCETHQQHHDGGLVTPAVMVGW
ncbi:hypothetical protein C2845_PM11G19390 [Panicum miliaceum]|uniref:Uncharacterized protein n=1 Tax=Panicum miliaceum TaxID=4540 RepID=A0A3L6RMW1_PANMI|nr:hypothetical protein C2845_PM11G19390 [Panicum miliaceum]